MGVSYRPACAQDLPQADALVVRAINDLTQRHGFGPMATPGPTPFQSFSLQDDPGGLWVAEEAGRIAGFAFSWTCEDLWFLAQLFVAPDRQGRSIGRELLRRSLQHAETGRAANRALITFAFNRVSQALYIRHGFFPQTPIYGVEIAREDLAARLPAARLGRTLLRDEAEALGELARIDLQVLGASREKHHRYLLGQDGMRGYLFLDGDDPVAYAYVGSGGHVGPLAVGRPDAVQDAFADALILAAEQGAPRVSASIPGAGATMLAAALDLGMQITFPMLLMATRSFGDWSRYLPRNPGFM